MIGYHTARLRGCTAGFVASLLLVACAASKEERPLSASGSAQVASGVDYHTHINSLQYSSLNTAPLLPTISLPAELQDLLNVRTSSRPDEPASAFAANAVFLNISGPNWIKGQEAIANFLRLVSPGYRMRPVAYELSRSGGFVAGTITRGEGAEFRHTRNFHLSLTKEGGRLRIASESWSSTPPPMPRAVNASELLTELDAGAITKAVIHSAAFVFGSVLGPAPNEYAEVQRENDWIDAQAGVSGGRLLAFCSFNPLKPYALNELKRCATLPHTRGIKLHFSDSGVDLSQPEHLSQLREVFTQANRLRLHLMVHIARLDEAYEPTRQAQVFLQKLLPLIPDVTVQIAHLGGDTGFTKETELASRVFAAAIAAKDPATRNLYFDIAGVVVNGQSPEDRAAVVGRIRQLGMQRILFGSDRHAPRNEAPGDAWKTFRTLPLTDTEFRQIGSTIMPYWSGR